MKETIQKAIDLLKKRVKDNLEVINSNQTQLNEMLGQPFSVERTYQIEKNYASNKALLAENNDLISLQVNLVKFLEKYKDLISQWETESEELTEMDLAVLMDDDELFELTIQGKLGYENGHPKFNDELFFNRLLEYYASIEAYEKCDAILTMRKKKHSI